MKQHVSFKKSRLCVSNLRPDVSIQREERLYLRIAKPFIMKQLFTAVILASLSVSAVLAHSVEDLEIQFEKYQLDNGLTVFLHEDHSDPVVSDLSVYNASLEMAGSFRINATLGEGFTPDEAENEKFKAFGRFELDGFTDQDIRWPEIWRAHLSNGIAVMGIEKNESPNVNLVITLNGSSYLDKFDQPGAASILFELFMTGTRNKSNDHFHRLLESYGASIAIYGAMATISIVVTCPSESYEKVFELIGEMLLEPQWNDENIEDIKSKRINRSIQTKLNPASQAWSLWNQLVYGESHILSKSTPSQSSMSAITMTDVFNYYTANIVPGLTFFQIAGNITKERVMASLEPLVQRWPAREFIWPTYPVPEPPLKPIVYLIDIPNAPQAAICIGTISLAKSDPDYLKVRIVNEKFGGRISGSLFQVLREKKGFTYGISSTLQGTQESGTFLISASVKSSATAESVKTIRNLMEKFRQGITEKELKSLKKCLLKNEATKYETGSALTNLLTEMNLNNRPLDFLERYHRMIKEMTLQEFNTLALNYFNPNRMYYVIAGDAATLKDELAQLGLGEIKVVDPSS